MSGSSSDPSKSLDAKLGSEKAAGQRETDGGEKAIPSVEGSIGELLVYQSGAIKMRLGDGILMDVSLIVSFFLAHSALIQLSAQVTAATQAHFLQQAVNLDSSKGRINVLGEVNRRFIVSPDIEQLLEELEREQQQRNKKEPPDMYEGLASMDIDP